MADIRAAAVDTLAQVLEDQAGNPCVYRRGAESVSFTATITDPTSVSENAAVGIAVGLDLEILSLVVRSEYLVLGGSKTTPQQGDEVDVQVETTAGTETRTYAVTRQGGDDYFRYSDPLQTIMRIHLTHLSTT